MNQWSMKCTLFVGNCYVWSKNTSESAEFTFCTLWKKRRIYTPSTKNRYVCWIKPWTQAICACQPPVVVVVVVVVGGVGVGVVVTPCTSLRFTPPPRARVPRLVGCDANLSLQQMPVGTNRESMSGGTVETFPKDSVMVYLPTWIVVLFEKHACC